MLGLTKEQDKAVEENKDGQIQKKKKELPKIIQRDGDIEDTQKYDIGDHLKDFRQMLSLKPDKKSNIQGQEVNDARGDSDAEQEEKEEVEGKFSKFNKVKDATKNKIFKRNSEGSIKQECKLILMLQSIEIISSVVQYVERKIKNEFGRQNNDEQGLVALIVFSFVTTAYISLTIVKGIKNMQIQNDLESKDKKFFDSYFKKQWINKYCLLTLIYITLLNIIVLEVFFNQPGERLYTLVITYFVNQVILNRINSKVASIFIAFMIIYCQSRYIVACNNFIYIIVSAVITSIVSCSYYFRIKDIKDLSKRRTKKAKHMNQYFKQFYHNLLSMMPQGIIIIDESENLVYANRTTKKILQCSSKSTILQSLSQLIVTKATQDNNLFEDNKTFVASRKSPNKQYSSSHDSESFVSAFKNQNDLITSFNSSTNALNHTNQINQTVIRPLRDSRLQISKKISLKSASSAKIYGNLEKSPPSIAYPSIPNMQPAALQQQQQQQQQQSQQLQSQYQQTQNHCFVQQASLPVRVKYATSYKFLQQFPTGEQQNTPKLQQNSFLSSSQQQQQQQQQQQLQQQQQQYFSCQQQLQLPPIFESSSKLTVPIDSPERHVQMNLPKKKKEVPIKYINNSDQKQDNFENLSVMEIISILLKDCVSSVQEEAISNKLINERQEVNKEDQTSIKKQILNGLPQNYQTLNHSLKSRTSLKWDKNLFHKPSQYIKDNQNANKYSLSHGNQGVGSLQTNMMTFHNNANNHTIPNISLPNNQNTNNASNINSINAHIQTNQNSNGLNSNSNSLSNNYNSSGANQSSSGNGNTVKHHSEIAQSSLSVRVKLRDKIVEITFIQCEMQHFQMNQKQPNLLPKITSNTEHGMTSKVNSKNIPSTSKNSPIDNVQSIENDIYNLSRIQNGELHQSKEKTAMVLVFIEDITQQMYVKQLEELNRYKMKMLSSISHELKTPLNCTMGMLDQLLQYIQSENFTDSSSALYIKSLIQPAQQSNILLLSMIRDLLDLGTMELGDIRYNFSRFSLKELLEDKCKIMQAQGQLKKIEISLFFDDDIEDMIVSDENRIGQIIINFLSNSLKFTGKNGKIIVRVEQFANTHFKITIEDNGIGIPQKKIKNIFQMFSQNEVSIQKSFNTQGIGKLNIYTKNIKGCLEYFFFFLGIGLQVSWCLAKGLTLEEFQDKPISVNSEEKKGTIFQFVLKNQDLNLISSTHYDEQRSQQEDDGEISQEDEIDENNNYTYKQFAEQNPQALLFTGKRDDDTTFVTTEKSQIEINQKKNSMSSNVLHNFDDNEEEFQNHHKKRNYSLSQKPHFQEKAGKTQKNWDQSQKGDTMRYFFGIEGKEQDSFDNEDDDDEDDDECENIRPDESERGIRVNQTDKKQINNISDSRQKQFEKYLFDEVEDQNYYSRNSMSHLNNQISHQNQVTTLNNLGQLNHNNFYNNNTNQEFIKRQISLPQDSLSSKQFLSQISNQQMLLLQPSQNNIKQKDTQSRNSIMTSHNLDPSTAQMIGSNISFLNVDVFRSLDEYISQNQQYQQELFKEEFGQILVVDDVQFNLITLQSLLKKYHLKVDLAHEGEEAVAKVKEKFEKSKTLYKIIFMDIQMPVKDGFQATKEIRKYLTDQNLPQIPVIATSAFSDSTYKDQAKKIGITAYLEKPLKVKKIDKVFIKFVIK